MKKTLVILSLFMIFSSCKEKNKENTVIIESNGRMNHVLLVIDNSQWKTEVGAKLKEIIGTPVIGMPQQENQFDITQVPSDSFGRMFKSSRNILIVQLDTINAFQTKRNLYARPQQVVQVLGTSEEQLVKTLELYKNELISTFKKSDIENIQQGHVSVAFKKDRFKTLNNFGIELNIPNYFKTVKDTGEFLWLRQYLSGGIAVGDSKNNILVYSVPIPKDKRDMVQTISEMRDSIGKIYLKGSKENMYMITEKAFDPRVFQTKLAGKLTYQTFGKWELLNDYMAGPFVNFAIEDTKNNRWIVLEGFTYAPSVDKRDYLFELEAIIKTVKMVK